MVANACARRWVVLNVVVMAGGGTHTTARYAPYDFGVRNV